MVIDQVANKQCDHTNNDLTDSAAPAAEPAISTTTGVDMGNQAICPVNTTTNNPTQVELVAALSSGLIECSKNANNNSNSSVEASDSQDAPGDDGEAVVDAAAVDAEQAPVEEQPDQPADEQQQEGAPVEDVEYSAPEATTDAEQQPISDNLSEYSESIGEFLKLLRSHFSL